MGRIDKVLLRSGATPSTAATTATATAASASAATSAASALQYYPVSITKVGLTPLTISGAPKGRVIRPSDHYGLSAVVALTPPTATATATASSAAAAGAASKPVALPSLLSAAAKK